MKDPIDRILEALQSHPDPFCARKLAEQELDEIVGREDECEFCGGVGLSDRYDEGHDDGEEEGKDDERARVVAFLRQRGHEELADFITAEAHCP